MKNILGLFIVLLFTISLQAQHTISGTFSPAKEYTWLIAYRLKPGTQTYVADTSIKEGKFTLNMPVDAITGTYRIVYAVPQEEFYFDVIYDGKEDIELTFNTEDGVSFITSNENKILSSYYKNIEEAKQKIINFYIKGKTSKSGYANLYKDLTNIQKNYETKSKGLISNNFIVANKPSIPKKYDSIQGYAKYKKLNYFNYIDFKNPVLLSSGFISDKVTKYVFTSLPLEELTAEETEAAVIKNIKKTTYYSLGSSTTFRFHVYYTLWTQAVATGMNRVSDYVYANFLKDLGKETNNLEINKAIETHNRLRIGALAPDIVWKEDKKTKKLRTYQDEGVEKYVLVFWSSTCSHCLKEVPQLHQELKENKATKVIAIGLEDEAFIWEQKIEELPNFEHVLSLGKWESHYAKVYDINATPSYFVLDTNQKIIAKPETKEEVINFLEKKE